MSPLPIHSDSRIAAIMSTPAISRYPVPERWRGAIVWDGWSAAKLTLNLRYYKKDGYVYRGIFVEGDGLHDLGIRGDEVASARVPLQCHQVGPDPGGEESGPGAVAELSAHHRHHRLLEVGDQGPDDRGGECGLVAHQDHRGF